MDTVDANVWEAMAFYEYIDLWKTSDPPFLIKYMNPGPALKLIFRIINISPYGVMLILCLFSMH